MEPIQRNGDSDPRRAYLIVAPWRLDAIGGVSTVIRGLMSSLSDCGDLRPVLMINDWDATRLREGASTGLRAWFLCIPDPLSGGPLPSRLKTLIFRLPFSLLQLSRFLKRERVAVVNVHYPGLSCVAFLILRTLGVYRGKVILSFHGLDVRGVYEEASSMRRWLWRTILKGADALVACSRRLALEMAQMLPLEPSMLRIVNNGVDVAEIERLASSSRGPWFDRPYIVCLATFEHRKGLDTLIQAFRSVARANPHVDLVIAGRQEPYVNLVQQLIHQIGAEHRVQLIPDLPHEEAMGLVSRARLLVMPSRQETFGLVSLEAIALNIPVVLTDVCGVVDVLPATLVETVPSDDPEALAHALLDVLDHPSEATERVRELRQFVKQRLSWDSAARQYARVAFDANSTE